MNEFVARALSTPPVPGYDGRMPPTPFIHRRRITYSECTIGNHVYYSRYLDLLEEARGEFFRSIGWPLLKLRGEGITFPVRECRLRYEAPARYDDVIAIELWIIELDRLWLKFGFAICGAKEELLVAGQTDHICASTDEKPKRMPKEVLAALRPFGHSGD
jgi:acyl-CoA thioester hydrolase